MKYYLDQYQRCGSLTEYVIGLHRHLNQLHKNIYSSLPDPDALEGTHDLQPGDWVMVKKASEKGSGSQVDRILPGATYYSYSSEAGKQGYLDTCFTL